MTYTPHEDLAETDPTGVFLDSLSEDLELKEAGIPEESFASQLSGTSDTTVQQDASSPETQTHHESGKIKGVATVDFLIQQGKERRAWKDLPDGPEKDAAREAWNIKYYGKANPNAFQRYAESTLRSPLSPSSIGGPAAALGLVDTGTDLLNILPGVNIPKIGEFESQALEAVRDLSGLLLPMFGAKKLIVSKATSIHKAGVAPKWMQKLGNDKFFKYISEAGLDLGVGASVDYVVEQSQTDQNLSGTLKKSFPKFFQWIPNSIATNDNDSSDLKRTKNIREGAFLSYISSIIEGATRLTRAGASMKRTSTKFIPEDSLAKSNLQRNTVDEFTDVQFHEDPIVDNLLRSQAREQRELDKLGQYYYKENPASLEPKVGLHDSFDPNEISVRPKDQDGLAGATVDAVRIQENIDSTYGRLGSIIHEDARQLGLKLDNLSARTLVKNVAEELQNLGKYSANLVSGKTITSKQIDDAGTRLAEILNNPRMEPGQMKQLLDEFKEVSDKGLTRLKRLGASGVAKSIDFYQKEFFSMNAEKARAYLLTSEAGQISDIAEGYRLMEGTTAISRAQDQMLDRIEYLMIESRLAKYQNGLRRAHLESWKEAVNSGDPAIMDSVSKEIMGEIDGKLSKIIPETKEYVGTLRGIKDSNPDFLDAFWKAQEDVDGNIDSLYKLHTWARNKLGTFSKAVYDGKPKVSSIMVRTQHAIIFNSILSALATPIRALTGNVGGLIGKPTAVFTGAIARGELDVMRRAWHQYSGFTDSFMKAFEHMKVVYRKAATDPTKVGYIMRDDLAIKEVKELDVLQSYADAASKNGEDGAQVLLSIWREQDKLARHPWLRFGSNAMTALDGFNRAMYATAEAKGKAFDAIMESGQEFSEQSFKKASDQIYDSFFDSNGMITDDAVDFATRESALNLDSNLVKGMNGAIARFPILRSIFLFPKTQANSLDIFRKWSPADMVGIGPKFEGDYAAFTKHSWEDYPKDEVQELLASKGIAWDNAAETKFKTLQAEYTGRVAIGTTTMIGGGILAVQGRIRGNGHWDQQTQRGRRELGWEKKTIQGLDGNWYSYEFLGPIGDIIALGVDLVDNFDSISTGSMEKLLQKGAFIIGASLTNRSFISQMEPVSDIFSGNPAAMARWTSQYANAFIPFAGLRGELSKIMAPMKREYNNDIGDLIRNRNNFLDVFDPDSSLPYKYNFVTGEQIGRPQNMFARFNNVYSPIKVHDDSTVEEEFLMEIEYDSKPFFKTSKGGIEYDIHQRAELYSKVGEQGYFKSELKRIMRDANKLTYTTPDGTVIKGFKNIMLNIRRGNIPSEVVDYKEYAMIFKRIDRALRQSTKLAEASLRGTGRFIDLSAQETIRARQKQKTRQGNINQTSSSSIEEQLKQFQEQIKSR